MEYSENKHYTSYPTILKYLMPIYDILYIFYCVFNKNSILCVYVSVKIILRPSCILSGSRSYRNVNLLQA